MYDVIDINSPTNIKVSANQYDHGKVVFFTTAHSLTGQTVKAFFDCKGAGIVVSSATVADAHTLSVCLPVQCTMNPGTYDLTLTFYGEGAETNELERWKSDVLAGKTPILVAGATGATGETVPPAAAVSSFLITVQVYPTAHNFGLSGLSLSLESEIEQIKMRLDALEGV